MGKTRSGAAGSGSRESKGAVIVTMGTDGSSFTYSFTYPYGGFPFVVNMNMNEYVNGKRGLLPC